MFTKRVYWLFFLFSVVCVGCFPGRHSVRMGGAKSSELQRVEKKKIETKIQFQYLYDTEPSRVLRESISQKSAALASSTGRSKQVRKSEERIHPPQRRGDKSGFMQGLSGSLELKFQAGEDVDVVLGLRASLQEMRLQGMFSWQVFRSERFRLAVELGLSGSILPERGWLAGISLQTSVAMEVQLNQYFSWFAKVGYTSTLFPRFGNNIMDGFEHALTFETGLKVRITERLSLQISGQKNISLPGSQSDSLSRGFVGIGLVFRF